MTEPTGPHAPAIPTTVDRRSSTAGIDFVAPDGWEPLTDVAEWYGGVERDWTRLAEPVGVETVLASLASTVIRAAIQERTTWSIDESRKALADQGVMYSRFTVVTVTTTDLRDAVEVASLILNGDRITHYQLREREAFSAVHAFAKALGVPL